MQAEWDHRTSRDLDSFEEFFWYMENVAPTLHFKVLAVTGKTSPEDWQNAWRSLHADFPLLKFRILKEVGKRPRFVETDRHARIEVEAGCQNMNLSTEAEHALTHPFTNPEQDLVLLRVNHNPNACIVSLAAHHSLFDGTSALLLLWDLLGRVSGEGGRTHPPLWTSLRDVVAAQPRSGYRTVLAETTSPGPLGSSLPVQVRHLAFAATLTKQLEQVARLQNTTPHGALMVALQLAGATARPTWAREGVGCNTPHNVRGTGIYSDATGMLTMPLITALPPAEFGHFWEAARAARNALSSLRSMDGRRAFVAAMDNLTADEMTPPAFLAKIADSPIAYELMISNYASYRPRSDYGRLQVTSIATGNNGGNPVTQTIGVCTLNGTMNLTQVSVEPIANLLERCREVITRACCV